MDWKLLAEIIATEVNKNSTVQSPVLLSAIRAGDEQLYRDLMLNTSYPGDIYPVLAQIAEKYKMLARHRALNGGEGGDNCTMNEALTKGLALEFKETF